MTDSPGERVPPPEAAPASVGRLLRRWRTVRGFSQLELAHRAGMAPRQISFIETGRSRPRRETLLKLGLVLGIPMRDQNALLVGAGHRPHFTESGSGGATAAGSGQVIDFLLERQDPYSAVALDGSWNIRGANRTFAESLAPLVDGRLTRPGEGNLLRVVLHRDGLLPYLQNAQEVAVSLAGRVFREALGTRGDSRAPSILEGLAADAGLSVDPDGEPASRIPRVSYRLRIGERDVSLFSVGVSLGTPTDAALAEERVEVFFPLDSADS